MSDLSYDVNTPDGRARVRELVAQGRLRRWPLSTEIMAAQLDIAHDELVSRFLRGKPWSAVLRRFGIEEADEQRAPAGYLLVEKGVLTPLEGLLLDDEEEEVYFAAVLSEFTDEELAEELHCDPSVIWRLQLWPRHFDGLVNTAHLAEVLHCDYARLIDLVRAVPSPDELYAGHQLPSYRHLLRRNRQLQLRDPPGR